jgi:ATP-binding cassette, subfamily C, bacterial
MKLIKPIHTQFLADLKTKLGWKALLLVSVMVMTGLLDGGGIAMLYVLLGIIGMGGEQPGMIQNVLVQGLSVLGVPFETNVVLILVIVTFFAQYNMYTLQSWLTSRLQTRYSSLWQKQLFKQIIHSRWSFFVNNKSGDLNNAIISETIRLSDAYNLIFFLFKEVIFVIVYFGLSIAISWQISSVLLVLGGGLFGITHPIVKHASLIGKKLTIESSKLHSLTGEFIGGAKLIKSSASEGQAVQQFDEVVDTLRSVGAKSIFEPDVVHAIFGFVSSCLLAVTLVVATQKYMIAPATIAVVLVLFMRLFPRLSNIQKYWQRLNMRLPAFVKTMDIIEQSGYERELLNLSPLPQSIIDRAVGIKLNNVSVFYNGKAALDNINLEIPAKKFTALVGGSGAGKSTLVDCLLRLACYSVGNIEIDNIPLSKLPLTSWRRSIGYVSQEVFLFNASIRDNICWGNETASDEKIFNATKKAFAHDFISALPDGYETRVGDRGTRLSGGQRQRIGLARALLNQVSLLILDEATSALDSESETQVMRAIENLRGSLTIIVIAHRLATIKNADLLYVLEEGQLIESGTWSELIASNGHLNKLWTMQSQHIETAS